MANQINKRDQLGQPNPNIMARQTIIPKIGTNGTKGVLKLR